MAASLAPDPNLSSNGMGEFFHVFFSESSCLVGAARRQRYPRVGIMFSLTYPCSVGVLFTGRGRVEPCLRRVFRDPVGLGIRWIRLDSAGFRGLRSFYKLFLLFSLGRLFASHILAATFPGLY